MTGHSSRTDCYP